MEPVRRDLTITQGASWTAAWQFRLNAQPFIDSTWTARAQVRDAADSDVVLHEWSTTAGTITIDGQGHLTMAVDPATSSAWSWRYGVYDLEVSKAGTTHRLLEGGVSVDAEVTR